MSPAVPPTPPSELEGGAPGAPAELASDPVESAQSPVQVPAAPNARENTHVDAESASPESSDDIAPAPVRRPARSGVLAVRPSADTPPTPLSPPYRRRDSAPA